MYVWLMSLIARLLQPVCTDFNNPHPSHVSVGSSEFLVGWCIVNFSETAFGIGFFWLRRKLMPVSRSESFYRKI